MNRSTLLSIFAFVLSACSTLDEPSTSAGTRANRSKTPLVDGLSATEALKFKEVGVVSCSVLKDSGNPSEDEQSCRIQLQQNAAREFSGDVAVIETRGSNQCPASSKPEGCLNWKARVYRAK